MATYTDMEGKPFEAEKGLEEEGFFDVVKPYKEAAKKKLDELLPKEGLVSKLAKGSADILLPDNPLDAAGSVISKFGKAATMAMGAAPLLAKFPKASEAARVFRKEERATKEAFKDMPEEMQQLKRAQALEQLGLKGPPPPAATKPAEWKYGPVEKTKAPAAAPKEKWQEETFIDKKPEKVLDYSKFSKK